MKSTTSLSENSPNAPNVKEGEEPISKRTLGVSGLVIRQEATQQQQRNDMDTAFSDLEALMTKAQEMVLHLLNSCTMLHIRALTYPNPVSKT
jgi:hypothetical protein